MIEMKLTQNRCPISRERENAGLNVTCASRVFLVESVVNHTFEVQGTFVFRFTLNPP